MKKILNYLFEHKSFSREAAKDILINISKGVFNDSELAAFMTVYLMRSITINELLGFRDALLELCVPVNLNGYNVLDIVGTGGDAKNTFNISTLSCFVVAGAGGKVAKHGNYGVSSISGASNLMELVGYKFKADEGKLKTELEESGLCFLHAPLFHPALRHVAGVRRQLGVRTFFNMLGPLVNPALAQHQLIGVYSLEMARVYNYLFQQTDKQFVIVHSLDGYDEISLTADTKIITNKGERDWTPEQLGKRKVHPEDIYGGNSVEEAAKIFMKILKGEGTWAQNSVVFANAAMGLHSLGNYNTYDDAFNAAVASLESGNAYKAFKKLIELQ
ncbi:anthranilate phosphoribosyltransferase [Chitinophaga sp. MM2321]|uniref:anthranilate phosphoribosyltransferase n=1 Tax=Chitinophaga sp. MM2321 TaxID=3137178 RepID=UPI0032D58E12